MIGKLIARMFGAKPPATAANLSIGETPKHIDALPFARRAIELFGGVREDRAEWLAAAVAKHLDGGRLAEAILADGLLLSKDEVAGLGMDRWRKVAREPLEALTPEGRKDPIRTLEIVAGRVASWLYAENQRHQFAEDEGVFFEGCLVVAGDRPCAQIAEMKDKLFPLPDAPLLPLWGCAQECQCRLRVERRRRKR